MKTYEPDPAYDREYGLSTSQPGPLHEEAEFHVTPDQIKRVRKKVSSDSEADSGSGWILIAAAALVVGVLLGLGLHS